MAEIKFEFSPEDKGFSAFIEKVKKQFQDLHKVQNPINPQDNENVKALRQQIDHIKSKIAAQKEYLTLLDKEGDKLRAKGNVMSSTRIGNQAAGLGNTIESNQTKVQSLDRKLGELVEALRHPDTKEKESTKEKPESIFNSLLAVNLIRDLGGLVKSMPSGQNSVSYIKPIAGIIGTVIGGIGGGLLGMIPGLSALKTLGPTIGKDVGEFIGGAVERTVKQRDGISTALFNYQAITGRNQGIDDQSDVNKQLGVGGFSSGNDNRKLSAFGIDFQKSAEMIADIAKSQGSNKNVGDRLVESASLKAALGIDNNTSNSILSLNKENAKSQSNLVNIVGGILKKGSSSVFAGGDHTNLGAVLERYTTFQKELLQSQISVSESRTAGLLFAFNKMGGGYKAIDPRSDGKIQSVLGGISGAGGAFRSAIIDEIMRTTGKNYTDAQQEQQTSGSKLALRATNAIINRYHGQARTQIISENLTHNNADAKIVDLDALSRVGDGKLGSHGLTQKQLIDAGFKQTSGTNKNTAETSNAYTLSPEAGLAKTKDDIVNLFKIMLTNVTTEVRGWLDQQKDVKPPPVYTTHTVVSKGKVITVGPASFDHQIKN